MAMRINLFAGPCAGKSSMAARLFSDLKSEGFTCDYVTEWVKEWAYLGRRPDGYDQVFLFAEQLRRENLLLNAGVPIVITDAPLLLTICYGLKMKCGYVDELKIIADKFEKSYPSINIFIRRSSSYERSGRYETEIEALNMDVLVLKYLQNNNIPFFSVPVGAHEDLLSVVRKRI